MDLTQGSADYFVHCNTKQYTKAYHNNAKVLHWVRSSKDHIYMYKPLKKNTSITKEIQCSNQVAYKDSTYLSDMNNVPAIWMWLNNI